MKALLAVIGSFLVAALLCVLPLPLALQWFRPDCLLLVLLYWALAFPERHGVLSAVVVGLLQDVLTGSLLGKHPLAYCIAVSVMLIGYKRMRMFEPWQQAVLVLLLLLLCQLVEWWVDTVTGIQTDGFWFLLPALTGALAWPPLLSLLRDIRRKAGLVNRIA